MDPGLIFIISFLAIALGAAAVLMLVRDLVFANAQTVEARLPQRRRAGLLRRKSPADDAAAPSGWIARIDRWFDQLFVESGVNLEPQAAFLLAVAVGLLVGGAVFVWRDDIPTGVAAMVLATSLVILVFAYLRHRRRRAIHHQLPETVELLARAVRAGESLDQAIRTVGEIAPQPLAGEFQHCARQLAMGLSLDAAVRGLARRVRLVETRIFASTLMVQRQTGGNIPHILERLARVFRDRLSYERHFQVATAASRTSAVMITTVSLLGAIYLFAWQREYVQDFIDTYTGRMLLVSALVLHVVGLIWIFRVIRARY